MNRNLTSGMKTGRLEAFSDGVFAILITIMVLEFKIPLGDKLENLIPLLPTLISYVLSFIYLGIYWNNHHHLFQIAEHVRGSILWANLHLLFWLSLIPFATAWGGETHFAMASMILYGVILLMSRTAYGILVRLLVNSHGQGSVLAQALGNDLKGKISIALYLVGIIAAFFSSCAAGAIYILVALIWLVPDRRIEKGPKQPRLNQEETF